MCSSHLPPGEPLFPNLNIQLCFTKKADSYNYIITSILNGVIFILLKLISLQVFKKVTVFILVPKSKYLKC